MITIVIFPFNQTDHYFKSLFKRFSINFNLIHAGSNLSILSKTSLIPTHYKNLINLQIFPYFSLDL